MVEPFVIGDNDVTKTLDVVVIDHEGEDKDKCMAQNQRNVSVQF